MAARNAGRRFWGSFRASLAEAVVGSRSFSSSSQNVGKCKQIWEQGIQTGRSSSSSSSSSARLSSSFVAECRTGVGIMAWKRVGDSLSRNFSSWNSSGSKAEGLEVLLRSRPDAVATVMRSGLGVGSRSKQLMSSNSAAFFTTRSAGTGSRGARTVHATAFGGSNSALSASKLLKRNGKQSVPELKMVGLMAYTRRNFSSCSPASLLMTKCKKQSFSGFRKMGFAVACTRRSFSSSGGSEPSWREGWNKATAQVRSALSWRPATRAGAVVKASVGQGGVLAEAAKPMQRTFHRYKEAAGLQLEGFWKRNYLYIIGVVALGVCLLLWRLMYAIASSFITMSEGLAKYGVLALAASMVLVGGVYLRARYTINPDAVYRAAMRKLNTSASVLEVMGAPLAGTDLRAYVMSGGGFRLKNFKPTLAGKRCFVIFPIRGSERRGLVSIEVKKKKGQYNFKLLAIDIPTAGAAEQRFYLIGDEKEYKVGGGLIAELRDPIVKAMAAQKEFEDTDLAEEEDEERRAEEAEFLRAEEAEFLRAEEDTRKAAEAEKLREEEALKELEQTQGETGKEEDEPQKHGHKVLV